MKKILITLLCTGILLTGYSNISVAATIDEITNISDNYFAKKISKGDALSYLSKEATSDENSDEIKALALANQAVIFNDINDRNTAYTLIAKAIDLDPTHTGFYLVLAKFEAADGKFKQAIATADKALKMPGSNRKALQSWKELCQLASSPIDAVTFHKEFQKNLFAAEQKYKAKELAITGNIERIQRSLDGNPVIILGAGRLKYIKAELSQGDISFIAKLNKGTRVIILVDLVEGGEAIVSMKGVLFYPR